MKILAGENISGRIISRLRSEGHDVVSIAEEHDGWADTKVLELARSNGALLITEDKDFGDLVVRWRMAVIGVVRLNLDRLSPAREIERVVAVVNGMGVKLEGHMTVIEPGRTRLRPLPSRQI